MNTTPVSSSPLLTVQDLSMHFHKSTGLLRRKVQTVYAVNGVSLRLGAGQTLSLVGESGCGKSTLARTVMRLYRPTQGRILLGDTAIERLGERVLRPLRRNIQMVFQDPFASLNPRMTIFDIIAEPLRTHGVQPSRQELAARLHTLVDQVGLSPRSLLKYPHEFSGGQRQRVAIARALALQPKILICDEPVSALDVSIQAQIINLLQDLQRTHNLSYLFIAHDLAVVRHISQRVAVMFLGHVVEMGPRDEIFQRPRHPYTRALLASVPAPDPDRSATRSAPLKGDLPSPVAPPSGCVFRTRCPMATDICASQKPQWRGSDGAPRNAFESGFACHHA